MSLCDGCAIRLFNTKHYNLQGIGNPWSGNCIVIPTVDYDAYISGNLAYSKQVEIIQQVLSSTGEVTETLYLVPLIRCNTNIGCEIDDNAYNRCIRYFAKDVKTYNIKHILLLGDAGRRFLNCEITSRLNTLIVSKNARYYNVNYSPLIKYKDSDKFEVFKDYLIKWYNNARTNFEYNDYELLI